MPPLLDWRTLTASDVLARLRAETRAEHDAVEGVLGLASVALTHTSYVRCVSRFYGFYRPLEAALATLAADARWADLLRARTGKSALLAQDLAKLGIDAAALAQCRALPRLRGEADLLGCLYVVEGATLGGRLIASQLQARLGLTASTGAGFFHGYGEATASMWQALRRALVAGAPDAATENEMIANAKATFAVLCSFCDKEPGDEQIE